MKQKPHLPRVYDNAFLNHPIMQVLALVVMGAMLWTLAGVALAAI